MTPENMRIVIPEGCEVERIDTQEGAVVVTFKRKEPQLPKSWEEFCEMFPDYKGEYFIIPDHDEKIGQVEVVMEERTYHNAELLPDRATAEAVLALCQLIQLRDCYNQGWVPQKDEPRSGLYITADGSIGNYDYLPTADILQFPNPDLRVEFLNNFRGLIEKLKPLYGIKEGGEE